MKKIETISTAGLNAVNESHMRELGAHVVGLCACIVLSLLLAAIYNRDGGFSLMEYSLAGLAGLGLVGFSARMCFVLVSRKAVIQVLDSRGSV